MLEPKFIFGYAHKKSVGSIYSFRQFSKALDFLISPNQIQTLPTPSVNAVASILGDNQKFIREFFGKPSVAINAFNISSAQSVITS